jgi:F-type H+-transporting ATPase subunit alpha
MDGKGPIDQAPYQSCRDGGTGVIARKSVHEPCYTGLKAVDAMTPVGRGQRELIIGDRQIGKTAMCHRCHPGPERYRCLLHLRGLRPEKIHRCPGACRSRKTRRHGIHHHRAACASDPATLQYWRPLRRMRHGRIFSGQRPARPDYLRRFSKQAAAYRQVSLLLRRPPGREAYPGDIFYNHSRLLERSAKLSDDLGAGSLTALPIIETQAGDVSAYIPTNVISITDGQIYLEPGCFSPVSARPSTSVFRFPASVVPPRSKP